MNDNGAGFVLLMVLFMGAGVLIGWVATSEAFKREAVEQGAAHYDPKTKVFTWGELEHDR